VRSSARRSSSAVPHHLAVENELARRQIADGIGDVGKGLRQLVARQQADLAAVFEREQPDPIELALENPLGSAESLLSQRRRHRLDPLRES
jgi:hypothetical protein